jgi:hypothetical protein
VSVVTQRGGRALVPESPRERWPRPLRREPDRHTARRAAAAVRTSPSGAPRTRVTVPGSEKRVTPERGAVLGDPMEYRGKVSFLRALLCLSESVEVSRRPPSKRRLSDATVLHFCMT